MPKTETGRPRGPVSAESLRRLVRRSPLPVLLLHIETLRVVEASDALAALLGRDRTALLGASALDLTEQPATATKSMALVASGVIDGYTRRASFRLPSGEVLDRDLHITACTESDRQHAVVSVLPANWAADDAPALAMAAEDDTLTMGTVNAQWVVDRITTGEHPDLAFESGQMLNRSIFVAIHPEDVGALMFVAAQASRQRNAAFGRIRLRSPEGGWTPRRVGLQPLDSATFGGYAFVLFSGEVPDDAASATAELDDVVETTVANIRASAVASWMVMFPTALQLPALSELTARENEILLRLATGERVRQIAQGLHLGESTVRNHLTSVYRKTGVSSQGELLALLRQTAEARP